MIPPRFEVLDAKNQIVADGLMGSDPVSVLPGKYTVRVKGSNRSQSVTVQAKRTATVQL